MTTQFCRHLFRMPARPRFINSTDAFKTFSSFDTAGCLDLIVARITKLYDRINKN